MTLKMASYVLEKLRYLQLSKDVAELIPNEPDSPPVGNRATVRVRVAVAVNELGNYYAVGSNSNKDHENQAYALEGLYDDCREVVHTLEADVPLPATIPAEVPLST